jgi:hypothetical protein
MFVKDNRGHYLPRATDQYDRVSRMIARMARIGNALHVGVLTFSVVTSGSLWLLLSKTVPQGVLWFGAIASTLTSGITVYIKTSGINKKRSKALALYRDMGQFVAEVRTSKTLTDAEFWAKVKSYEFEIAALQHGQFSEDN